MLDVEISQRFPASLEITVAFIHSLSDMSMQLPDSKEGQDVHVCEIALCKMPIQLKFKKFVL